MAVPTSASLLTVMPKAARSHDARPWGDNRDADKGPDSRRC